MVSIELNNVATEVTHYNIQPTIELTMGVYGRDLGHVSDDVAPVLSKFGTLDSPGNWSPTIPEARKSAGFPDRRSCFPANIFE